MTLIPLSSLERVNHPVSPSRVKQLTPAFYPFGAGVFLFEHLEPDAGAGSTPKCCI